MKKAYLVLENGKVFEGFKIGADTEAVGEVIFSTGMVGYLELLTDKSYAGQIVVQTFPTIGNYGVIPEDLGGKCAVRGYVVREISDIPSNFRSQGTLEEYLKSEGVCGICGVDTRELTRVIREEGVMVGAISDTPEVDFEALKAYKVTGEVAKASEPSQCFPAIGEEKFRTAVIDFGAKADAVACLNKRGCSVKTFPYDAKAEDVLAYNPDGILLTSGPGDPRELTETIEQLKALIGAKPLLGIGLGHQLAALAMGGNVIKLTHGHHGANQPVRDLGEGRTYITAQNHLYAVDAPSVNDAEEIFKNANDGTNEGLLYLGKSAVTVQFHPEAGGGHRDTEFVFDSFIGMMEVMKNA